MILTSPAPVEVSSPVAESADIQADDISFDTAVPEIAEEVDISALDVVEDFETEFSSPDVSEDFENEIDIDISTEDVLEVDSGELPDIEPTEPVVDEVTTEVITFMETGNVFNLSKLVSKQLRKGLKMPYPVFTLIGFFNYSGLWGDQYFNLI